jgi:hypothetical protein
VRAAQRKINSDSLNGCAQRQFSLSQNTSYTLPPSPPPLYIFRQHVLFHTELFLDTDLLFNHNQTFKLLSKTSVMASRKPAAIASSADLNESASALSRNSASGYACAVMHTRQRDETENGRDMSRMIETFRECSRLSEFSARFLGKPTATD